MKSWRLSSPRHPKILIVRNDGLGDFLLTLPLAASLKRQLPEASIWALVNRGFEGLMTMLPDFSGAIADDGVLLKRHRLKRHRASYDREERRKKKAELLERIVAQEFDLAILPYAEWQSAALIHRARIPHRLGSLRRPFFWRFNMFNRESRKGSAKAEYQLNLGYLGCLGLKETFAFPRLELPPLGSPADGESGEYAVIHPYKRSGTALTWPMERFAALASQLLAGGLKVIVVGDGEDAAMLARYFSEGDGLAIRTELSLTDLTALIARARVFIGNSSGPLHLAGLTRTPHVGFYPQNRVSSPVRWRTLPWESAPSDPHTYLLSPRHQKSCVRCDMEKCPHFNCVADISMDSVQSAFHSWGLGSLFSANAEPLRAAGS